MRSAWFLRIGSPSEREFLVAGAAVVAGEGAKDHVKFANTDARMVGFFCEWLRYFFAVDESRLRVSVYLHADLDLDQAERFWSEVTVVARAQLGKPYRAVVDASLRTTKHPHGCVYVRYCCVRTHRQIMGLTAALLASGRLPG